MAPDTLRAARNHLAAARHIVVFTGAGVSAESGVPTFRDAQTGLWSRFDPEALASPQGFRADPGLVWRWYMWRLHLVEAARPNPGHLALVRLATRLPDLTLITQNVDDLHEQAGSRDVLHLHGNLARFRCQGCGLPHQLTPTERAAAEPPTCSICTERVRPHVVWFGEELDRQLLNQAWLAAEQCDLMLVVGAGGMVYPAAILPRVARQAGAILIDINPEPTQLSELAHLYLQGPAGQILPQLIG